MKGAQKGAQQGPTNSGTGSTPAANPNQTPKKKKKKKKNKNNYQKPKWQEKVRAKMINESKKSQTHEGVKNSWCVYLNFKNGRMISVNMFVYFLLFQSDDDYV